jgi:thiosulfate/3-mercaptopyruvate sulfurtransferase
MNTISLKYLCILFFLILSLNGFSQNAFKPDQLIQPDVLAKKIAEPDAKRPIILNVGAEENIKSAIEIGPLSSPSKQDAFKKAMAKIDKNEEIIIYCGCCKLKDCEKIQIALNYVKSKGYNKVKILNLPENLQKDWIDKEYPMNY